ncbi:hypothetical protein C2138_04995 [Salinibacterium hongtaonis]|nr:hypothetical protein C2138_04995 [Salinibacterium hongtaonis]
MSMAGWGAVFALTTGVILSGCSFTDVSEAHEQYSELDIQDLRDDSQAVVDCLEEAGYPGWRADDFGGIESPELPGEQFDLQREQRDLCIKQVGGNFSGTVEFDQAKIQRVYLLEVEAVSCLREQGYTVPEPPSEQSYIDGWGKEDSWHSWTVISDQIGSNVSELSEICPDPWWFLGTI